jgi:peptide/nickel transport system permease protein
MTATTATSPNTTQRRTSSRFNRFDSPWLNPKLLIGLGMILLVALMPLIGPLIYNTRSVLYGSSPQNLPPIWGESNIQLAFGEPTWDHPLGTQSDGRDMLAVLLVASPRSLQIGLIAAAIGVAIGIILGFSAGFLGGWLDAIIRTLSDAIITIPALAILIVIGSYLKTLNPPTMALLLACLNWAGPTRLIRAQVLTLRERGYVSMARLSGASTMSIMFREIMPNLLPYLASSFTGNVSGAILAATGLEVLGLGSTRFPTLGMTIFDAIGAAAILRGMYWWWGIPIIALIWIFSALYQITIGLDEIANPRLRGRKAS